MKLPGGEQAIIDIRKIRDYCLSEKHPRGRHKARVFAAKLGITASDSELLKAALQQAASTADAVPGVADEYGSRYIIDFEFKHRGRTASIRSCWIIRSEETVPRLITCFVL